MSQAHVLEYDTDKPNSGRMADYVLGGFHNFEADRVAADKVIEATNGAYAETIRQQRRFLQRAMTFMAQEKGLTHFLDFGSGLPTMGNVHEVVQAIHPDAKVAYSDLDPVCVTYGQDILRDQPNVKYLTCDVNSPEVLLDSPEVTGLFGDERRVGLGFVGVSFYLSEDTAAEVMQTVYDWAAPGSYMAWIFVLDTAVTVAGGQLAKTSVGAQYLISKEDIPGLLAPWKLTEPGVAPFLSWGLDDYPGHPVFDKIQASLVAYKP
jgi:hypothetical protein